MTVRRRPTIRDIAREAGVSATAVSFALNNRPGIAPETRKRILELAQTLGWTPSIAARALSSSKAGSVGLVMGRTDRTEFAPDRFLFRFMTGVESRLYERGTSFVFHTATTMEHEVETYDTWWSERRVDGVIVVDLREDDPRPAQLKSSGLPAVFVGADPGYGAAVVCDQRAFVTQAFTHLDTLELDSLAYVSGTASRHGDQRSALFAEGAKERDLHLELVDAPGYSEPAGRAAMADLLDRCHPGAPPRLVVFDNALLCLGASRVLKERGFTLPEDVALMSLEDSDLCEVMEPTVTALHRDPVAYGEYCADLAVELIADEVTTDTRVRCPAPFSIAVRASTRMSPA
ncbi:MAG: LacI family DNA-binding transcriptional regulator [Bowdeniella nasicola]|nr:LacI family DNA-binding transcriptional regulator [Bowdeniella nasicola]